MGLVVIVTFYWPFVKKIFFVKNEEVANKLLKKKHEAVILL